MTAPQGPAGQTPPAPVPGTRTYESTVEADLQRQAFEEAARTGGNPFDIFRRLREANAGADRYSDEQERTLREAGVQTRDAPAMPGTHYQGYDHHSMKSMVNDDMDPGQVDETGAAWNELGNKLIEFEAAMKSAVSQSREDWSGESGAAARNFMTGVGAWMGSTGKEFHLASNRMHAQSEAAGSAKSAMPEPVDFSMGDAFAMLANERNPFNMPKVVGEINQKFDEKQQAHDDAARVMTTFSQSLADSGSGMPSFKPVPTMAGPSGSDSGNGFTNSTSNGTGDGFGGVGGNSSGSGGYQGPGPGSGGGSGIGSQSGGTGSQGYQGGTGGLPVGPGPWGNPGGGPGTGPGPGMFPVGGPPGGPGTGRGGTGGPGSGRGPGGSGSGRSGFGPGGGSTGQGAGGRAGVGSGGAAGQGPGVGARGPGALAADHAAGGRGGAAGARGGAGGMGGGGRGQGGEDEEHNRPDYLIEADPEGLFGTDEITAPPVIGQ